jgi:hypothetical protein
MKIVMNFFFFFFFFDEYIKVYIIRTEAFGCP